MCKLELDPEELRRKAEECARNANLANNDCDKAAWLKLAEDWERLARAQELRAASSGDACDGYLG
ncbi:hypothetical protein ACQR1W_26940 [Bradyrhizobium sp. HKCCYLS1011]|uniref:hypothetical protein n=1 Tax=Bradyrhizobium sp. HKCCYLS1011 TaxID=3420733 RepID=UPI003EBEAA1D